MTDVRLRALDHLPLGVLVVRGRSITLGYANPAASRISRWDLTTALGRRFDDVWPGMMDRLTPEGSVYRAIMHQVLDGDRPSYSFDVEWDEDHAGHGWYHITWTHVEPGVVVILYSDVTSDSLRKAKQHLDNYASLVNHEIRSTLGRVSLATDVILAETAKGENMDLARVQKYSEIASRGAAGMRAVTETLAATTRVDGGDVSQQMYDLRELAREACTGIDHVRQEDTITILGQGEAWCDEGLVRLAVRNLVSNSAKYGDAELPRMIEIWVEDRAIEVRDDGWGIDVAHIPCLFETFSRFHPGTTGSGLGLALCRRIAGIHNGSITYKPNTPRGSVFRLTFGAPSEELGDDHG